ncbi:putative serine/threonine-protein kinase pats1 [Glandiceps talaboti]
MVQVGKALPTRLHLLDFAGDELYYSGHHIFIPNHALYLIVFNFIDAVEDKTKQLRRILFWLHSIFIHSKDKDTAVFLVGTHRDSTNPENRQEVAIYFDRELSEVSKFYDRLVVNSNNTHVFPVENDGPFDLDMKNLREKILDCIQTTNRSRKIIPIRYLHFYKFIKEVRNQNSKKGRVMRYRKVLKLACTTYDIRDEQDFRDMLTFFHDTGEIIHQVEDVILDPQVLITLLKHLMKPPPLAHQARNLKSSWKTLKENGIVDVRLLEHMGHSIGVSRKQVESLLTAYDLMCPLSNDMSFLVPSLLCNYDATKLNGWKSCSDDDVFYFDFNGFLPDIVFVRLLARCHTSSSGNHKVYADVAVFSFGKDTAIWYKLEVLHHLPEQNLIKVTVQKAHGCNSRGFVQWLLEQVEAIKQRDFQYLEYTFGVLCPKEEHTYFRKLHIINLPSGAMDDTLVPILCESRKGEIELFRTAKPSTSKDSKTQPS